jgi:hypothetical protein
MLDINIYTYSETKKAHPVLPEHAFFELFNWLVYLYIYILAIQILVIINKKPPKGLFYSCIMLANPLPLH